MHKFFCYLFQAHAHLINSFLGGASRLAPLLVCLFETADNAPEYGTVRMSTHAWKEFEGDRGASNVASFLWKDFQHRGFLVRTMEV